MKPKRTRMAILLIAGLLLVPVPKLFVSEWSVHVTDQNGAPIAHIRVTQHWTSYTFSVSGGADLYTDSDGSVTFAKQRLIRPVIYWPLAATWNLINLGVHASSGTFVHVGVSNLREWHIDATGQWPSGANCADADCTTSSLHSELRVVSGALQQ